MEKIKGIDISHWQGSADFSRIKKAGYDFVILKAGGSDKGFYEDKTFKRNYEAAKKAGMHIGAYYFVGSNFYGSESGVADAKRFIKIIGECKLDYPLFLDVETTQPVKKKEATDAAIAFCDTLEDAGFYAGIYASDISGFREKLDHSRLKAYAHWVADYNDPVKECTEHQMRQYSSKGYVDGIQNNPTDIDYSLIDYPELIKSKGLNNFKKRKKKTED